MQLQLIDAQIAADGPEGTALLLALPSSRRSVSMIQLRRAVVCSLSQKHFQTDTVRRDQPSSAYGHLEVDILERGRDRSSSENEPF